MTPYDVNRILDELRAVAERLAVIETKLDANDTHDERINSLEKWRAALTGMVALVFAELQIIALVIAIRGGK